MFYSSQISLVLVLRLERKAGFDEMGSKSRTPFLFFVVVEDNRIKGTLANLLGCATHSWRQTGSVSFLNAFYPSLTTLASIPRPRSVGRLGLVEKPEHRTLFEVQRQLVPALPRSHQG